MIYLIATGLIVGGIIIIIFMFSIEPEDKSQEYVKEPVSMILVFFRYAFGTAWYKYYSSTFRFNILRCCTFLLPLTSFYDFKNNGLIKWC